MTPRIRRAQPDDGPRLRDVAFEAKAHWGYDREVIRDWADELDLPDDEERWVVERDGGVVGWASLEPPVDGVAVLDDLWVVPEAMGAGVGRLLFETVAGDARDQGASALEWGADPNAVGFYEHVGARRIRDHRSEWDRTVPWMRVEL